MIKLYRILLSKPIYLFYSFFLPIHLVIILIVGIISPFIKVRFKELRSDRIGHFGIETELYILRKSSKKIKEKNIDIFCCSKNISNLFLKKKLSENIKIFPRFLIFPIILIIKKLKKTKYLVPREEFYPKDNSNLLDNSQCTIKFSVKENCMLIYNKELSVCPITTHLPLKKVSKQINKNLIKEKVHLIDNFYKIRLKTKPKIGVLGLNPHCESVHKYNEDEKIIKPAIKNLKKKYDISGPYSADTMFLKHNRKKFDVIIGMYHDQVLTPLKTLYEYDAINITLGLPFIRISPDHGPNEKMLGKNKSNPTSLLKAIQFLDKN